MIIIAKLQACLLFWPEMFLLGGSLVMLGLGLLDAMVKMGSSSQGFELRLTLERNRD
jgi:hypothetical protein